MEAGMDEYISKPLEASKMEAVLEKFCGSQFGSHNPKKRRFSICS